MIGRKPDPARVVSWRIPVQVGPWRLPVALRMDERWPVSRYQVERTIAQAFAEAEARARRQIQEQLDGEVTILEETLEQYQPAPDRVGVRLRVETLEEIGVFVPYR